LKVEECGFSLKSQNRIIHWYIDSEYSKHMIGYKNMFVTLKKKKGGSVTFGNDNSTIIIGKCTVILGNKDVVAENVILVENIKHNLLSVIQMCDQGHTLIFNSK
jgi:hypothetical protein